MKSLRRLLEAHLLLEGRTEEELNVSARTEKKPLAAFAGKASSALHRRPRSIAARWAATISRYKNSTNR